jgi:hypothetical protein
MIFTRWVILRMRNYPGNYIQNVHIYVYFRLLFPKIVPFVWKCAKILRKQKGDSREYKTVMCFSCWISNAIDLHSDYVILIAFFTTTGTIQQYFTFILTFWSVFITNRICVCFFGNVRNFIVYRIIIVYLFCLPFLTLK